MLDNGGGCIPLTINEVAHRSGLGFKRCQRAIDELRSVGWIASTSQWKRRGRGPSGKGLLISSVLKMLTRKFWAALGLWGTYCSCRDYSLKKPILTLRTATYSLSKRGYVTLSPYNHPTVLPTAERERQRRNKAFVCLFCEHGGTPCSRPSCPLIDECMRLAANLKS